jgi:tetratricopeptide (TPR) repeat protein
MVRFHARDYTGASSAYSEAIEVARSAGEDRTVIHATRNLGAVLENGGDSANAKALYLEGIAASLREHDPRSAASLYIHLGTVARTDCEWMEAELHYRRAVELAELAHDVYVAGIARVELAVPLIEMGEVITAGDLLNECERTARSSDNYAVLAAVNRIRGKLALRSGRRDDAEMHFNEALGTSTTHNLTREKAEVLEDIGHLRQLQNRPILAKSAWREALEIFRELGAEGSVARLTQLIEA